MRQVHANTGVHLVNNRIWYGFIVEITVLFAHLSKIVPKDSMLGTM